MGDVVLRGDDPAEDGEVILLVYILYIYNFDVRRKLREPVVESWESMVYGVFLGMTRGYEDLALGKVS